MARVCIFCGGTPVSDEHVFPLWLVEILHRLGASYDRTRRTMGSKPSEHTFQTPVIEVTARRVCERCNNRWMSDIEKAAAPILSPLVQGQAVVLSPEDQEVATLWA